ncbi:gliding motility protein GldM [Nonlabens sp. MIC269]|uniref:type IX secretion system motor protein PorM/GldM n=1 Tax=Nonlabens sp. MIC269 TaxID=1476901 RepID=UPI000722F207|nr:gliding motility protein GldM [Nonlabens sp. MIC269]ALM21822.1 gliding motility protein GldM [Nonlabens sp. MIC269]
MAGGKQSPRQKMINLMYLVFIAMLALNMSKEVLNAFGLLNANIEESNVAATAKNSNAMNGLAQLASDQPEKYAPLKAKADKVDQLSTEYYQYLQNIKEEMEGSVEDATDYQVMDKADFLDQKFFVGDKLRPEGEEFLSRMTEYRDNMKQVVADNAELKSELDNKFTPNAETNRDGKEVEYMDYHYKGFPLIASIAKITLLQSQVKNIESEVLSKLTTGALKEEVSMNKYTTLMETPKAAYYNGETFDGQIVLGRKDATLKPKRVELKLDGRTLSENQYAIEDGRVVLKVGAGSVGDHKITGQLIFEQDGEDLPVDVEQSFATIAKPNSATISADKMNVVYRGVDNPMTITFAGVQSGNVNASAPGLRKQSGSSYIMSPGAGKEVKINVTGKLSTGETVSDSKTFRIKNLPRPTGMVAGEYDDVKKGRQQLAISDVDAKFLNFDFELKPRVTSFIFKVPGQPAIPVSGNRLNGAAKSALNRARKGDIVQFAKIKAAIPGVKVNLPGVSSVAVELTN